LVGLTARVHSAKPGPYEGLSRMKGNFHVRFLEGGGSVTARPYSTCDVKTQPSLHQGQEPEDALCFATGIPGEQARSGNRIRV